MSGRRTGAGSSDDPPFAAFVAETVRKPDGRRVTYYAWPADGARDAGPDPASAQPSDPAAPATPEDPESEGPPGV